MPDLGVLEVVVLATRNSKARPTIVRRFLKSLVVASPPPSLATNRAVTRPRSSLVPSRGTAFSQASSRSANRRSIGTSESLAPLAGRIVLDTNCTTPLSSVVVTTFRALALFSKDSSLAPVRSTRVAEVEAMAVVVVVVICMMDWLVGGGSYNIFRRGSPSF